MNTIEVRSHFPVLSSHAYLDTATCGLIPDYVYICAEAYMKRRCTQQADLFDKMNPYEMIEKERGVFAEMLGAASSDIAFGLSSSQLYVQFASGFPFQSGDNIIITDNSFISTPFAFSPMEQEGLEIRRAETRDGVIDIDRLCSYADGRTRIIAVNHVESSTGYRLDLAGLGAFCRKRGIILAVDAAQSAGAMEIDVQRMNIDFLAGTGYKWLMYFHGLGYGYFSQRLRELLVYRSGGWASDADRFNVNKHRLTPHSGARRYEFGTLNAVGIYCVSKTINRYLSLGKQVVEDYILSLADYVYERAESSRCLSVAYPFEKGNRSNIVQVCVPKKYFLSEEELRRQGVIVSVHQDVHKGSLIRLGLHYYVTREDIDKFFSAVENCCKAAS